MSALSTAEPTAPYAEQEWATRIELAALYRVLHRYGMTDIANQEIGARVQGEPDRFLVHPYGLLFEEVRASDLVKAAATAAMIEDQMRESANYNYDGSTEWADLLRKLERECPDYRT